MRPKTMSILSLGTAFVVFSIAIPLAQHQIDKKTFLFELWRFHAQQATFKYSSMLDKFDTGRYLDTILKEKVIDQKHDNVVSSIQDVLEGRCQELLADAIALFSSNPENEQDAFRKTQIELRKKPLETLFNIYQEMIENKRVAIPTKFQKDMLFWTKIRMWLYLFGGAFFIGGTVLQTWSVESGRRC